MDCVSSVWRWSVSHTRMLMLPIYVALAIEYVTRTSKGAIRSFEANNYILAQKYIKVNSVYAYFWILQVFKKNSPDESGERGSTGAELDSC